jgi:hypothetical protein
MKYWNAYLDCWIFIGFAYQGKEIVFRFIIEYIVA